MYIKDIEIHNYKGFKDASIEFHPKLNVFIGSNASGKTTLLMALIKSVYNITKQFAQRPELNSILTLSESDIHYDSNQCYIINTIENFPGYDNILKSILFPPNSKMQMDDRTRHIAQLSADFVRWYNIQVQNNLQTVPIFKFYPANRGSIVYNEFNESLTLQISQLETWANIYQNNLSYSRFFNWFFDHETNELRLQRDSNDFKTESPDLRGVRQALEKMFEFIGYGKVVVKSKQIKRYRSSKLSPTLIIENLNSKKIDEIDNKSDGEKAIITLVADIAYNLSLAKDFTVDNDFLNSPGVVMIDEIESHLHPNWQREIIPILTELFPNIQFFIATHSPQVIASVNSESIFVCQEFEIDHINLKTKGEDTNTLLKYIFNSTERPKEYIKLLQEFDLLLEKGAEYYLIEAKINEIDKIEKQDKSSDINVLVDELKLQLEAYKFDREYEANK